MKDKLEVGMYCYNKTNRKLGIGEIINFQRNNNVNIRYKNDIELVSIGNVIASNNVIDLIEVGDYVNGYKVSFIDKDYAPFIQCDYPVRCGTTNHYRFYEKEIYSIVTKEQFESMSYKLGDDK